MLHSTEIHIWFIILYYLYTFLTVLVYWSAYWNQQINLFSLLYWCTLMLFYVFILKCNLKIQKLQRNSYHMTLKRKKMYIPIHLKSLEYYDQIFNVAFITFLSSKGWVKKTGQTLFVILTRFLISQKSHLYHQKGHIHSFQNWY